MTLDEAIKHCEEVAEEKEQSVDIRGTNQKWVDSCKECAKEHRQLAGWLYELKDLREQKDIMQKIMDNDNQIIGLLKAEISILTQRLDNKI